MEPRGTTVLTVTLVTIGIKHTQQNNINEAWVIVKRQQTRQIKLRMNPSWPHLISDWIGFSARLRMIIMPLLVQLLFFIIITTIQLPTHNYSWTRDPPPHPSLVYFHNWFIQDWNLGLYPKPRYKQCNRYCHNHPPLQCPHLSIPKFPDTRINDITTDQVIPICPRQSRTITPILEIEKGACNTSNSNKFPFLANFVIVPHGVSIVTPM